MLPKGIAKTTAKKMLYLSDDNPAALH